MARQDVIKVISYLAAGNTPKQVERKSAISGRKIPEKYAEKILRQIRDEGKYALEYRRALEKWKRVMRIFPLADLNMRMKALEDMYLDIKEKRITAPDWKAKTQMIMEERKIIRDIAKESAQIAVTEHIDLLTENKFYDQRDKFVEIIVEHIKSGVINGDNLQKIVDAATQNKN